MKSLIAAIILCFLSFGQDILAQTVVDHQFNQWFMYFGNHRVHDKLGIHTETQVRRANFATNWQQSLTRLGLDIHVNDKHIVTAGYGFIRSWPYGLQPINARFDEHRIWEQYIIQYKVKKTFFHHRFRLEQRWLEQVAVNAITGERTTTGWNYRHRFRYRLFAAIPILQKMNENLFAAFYNESFVNFGFQAGQNSYPQNRLYGAVGYTIKKGANIQIGYLNQMLRKAGGVAYEINHTFQFGLTYNFDLRKTTSAE